MPQQQKIPKVIKKRDGRVVPFDEEKITSAIFKAMVGLGTEDLSRARSYSMKVVAYIRQSPKYRRAPTVENVQDLVERVLLEEGEIRLARAYISYREKRAQIRAEKQRILEKGSLNDIDKFFDVNALRVLKSRYLEKDEEGKLIEDPQKLFERVAVHAYLPSLLYDKRFFNKAGRVKTWPAEPLAAGKQKRPLAIGGYLLNHYHLEALKKMYDRFNKNGHMKLSWSQLLTALKKEDVSMHEKGVREFFELMVRRQFLPNTPAIANFGRSLGMGSACFVLDVKDSMEEIMKTLSNAAIIFKSGGGVGYNFSNLRPEGDRVKSTSGIASGPISFMQLFDRMTEVIKQGGIRRGANMGILNSNHPDIERFIKAKEGNKALRNFNISVLLMSDFWGAYRRNGNYKLINPRTGKSERTINARRLFDKIIYQAWESAEPGIIFFDRVNKYNPLLKHMGPIVTTNPCGEVLLYPNESCNLGSINIHAFISRGAGRKVEFDWDGLQKTVFKAVEFLDNIIDINKFPLPEIEDVSLKTRKIGLGVMGLADAMFALRIAYNSTKGLQFMSRVAQAVNYWSKIASVRLARERGSFPYYRESFYPEGKLPFSGFYNQKGWQFDWKEIAEQIKKYGLRNAYTTVIAPTGSISMIAGTSSGIEPVFSLVFEKNVSVGSFYYIDKEFELAMKEFGIYDESLLREITQERGSIQNIPYLPALIKKVFRVAYDLTPEDHVRALATFQKWVDSSISKTINFPADATVEDMKKSYLLAYRLGCKDVTVYRDSSIKDQVLSSPGEKKTNPSGAPFSGNNNENGIKKCPQCSSKLIREEGCIKCLDCGWALCI